MRIPSLSPNLTSTRGWILLLSCATCLVATTAMIQPLQLFADQSMPREQLPTSWKTDAELTDVFFLNPQTGWAVGAQGVILRTVDGGRNWREISQASGFVGGELSLEQKIQNMRSGARTRYSGVATDAVSADSPVRYRFDSVHFVNERIGWIGGGYEIPYVGRSRAILMRTVDGGQTWESVPSLVIPRISKVHFFDAQNGWAVGQSGNLFRASVYHTSNGGSTWSTKASVKLPDLLSAERTSQGFVTLDYEGRIGVFNSQKYEPAVMLGDVWGSVSQIRMLDDQNGLAVGSNGTLVRTENGGLSWSKLQIVDPNIEKAITKFDFRTVAVTPAKIWCAGDPGTFLFSVDRETGSAEAIRLPVKSRINKIVFAGEQIGYAVGALGTVLATKDGGANWKVQRGNTQRIAMLAVSDDPSKLPYELISKYGSEENAIIGSVLLNGTNRDLQIANQATERLGNSISVLLESGKAKDDQLANDRLEKMVRLIRTLQPNVVVCNSVDLPPVVGSTQNSNVVGLVRDSIRKAADQNAFPDQIALAGLKPWQANRLAVLDATGTVSIDPRQLLPRTGKLMEDQIAISRATTGQSILPGLKSVYRVTELTSNIRPKSGNLLSGLMSAAIPNRFKSNEKHGNLVAIQQASAKHKKFAEFVKFEANTPQDFLVWRQKIQSFALRMDSEVAGIWLMQLAEKYLAAGKMELAAGSAEMLVARFSEHGLAPTALTWLANYYASDEFGQLEFNKRIGLGLVGDDGSILLNGSDNEYNTSPAMVPAGNVSQLVWVPTNTPYAKSKNSSGKQEPVSMEQTRTKFFAQRHLKAGQFLKQLSRRDPELVAGSQFRMLDAHLAKRITGAITNEGRWQNLAKQNALGVGIAAHRELVINGFAGVYGPTTPVLNCSKTEFRPKLDGQLNDSCWLAANGSGSVVKSKVNFASVVTQFSPIQDTTLFSFDEQFLYVGINCQKLPGHYYNARKKARPRDADLNRRDRVEISIDVDRDYRSAFQLVVDHRGWVNDICAGSPGWDPNWYVSQSENESSWTVEIAVPLSQLSQETLDSSTVWAFGLKRRIFDNRNVWQSESEAEQQTNSESGLQVGLLAHPRQFELIRFGDPATTKLASKASSNTQPVTTFSNTVIAVPPPNANTEFPAKPLNPVSSTKPVLRPVRPTPQPPNPVGGSQELESFQIPNFPTNIPSLREAKGQLISPKSSSRR